MKYVKLIVAVAVLSMFALAIAQGDTRPTTYTTTAPTTGSAVVLYHWELKAGSADYVSAGTSTGATMTISLPWNQTCVVRVRGQDADGDFGPYSVPSDNFTPDRPGACGKPVRQ